MNHLKTTKMTARTNSSRSRPTLETVMREIRTLRDTVLFLMPQENIADYAHADRVKRSYRNALKQYPARTQ